MVLRSKQFLKREPAIFVKHVSDEFSGGPKYGPKRWFRIDKQHSAGIWLHLCQLQDHGSGLPGNLGFWSGAEAIYIWPLNYMRQAESSFSLRVQLLVGPAHLNHPKALGRIDK